jgi:hypothetical protein
MILPTPDAPFQKITHIIESKITIDISGSYLVMLTENPNILPGYNEYTGNRVPEPETISFTDTEDQNTGLRNLLYPWVLILDFNRSVVDFFLFSSRPTQIDVVTEDVTNIVDYASLDKLLYESSDGYQYTANDTPRLTELTLYPGNGVIFYGQFIYTNLGRDSNSDGILDVLDFEIEGSISKFLKSYDFSTRFYKTSDGYFYASSDEMTLGA